MPSPTPEARLLGESLRLALAHEPRRGQAGERLGRTVGSSLEFQDRRAYQAGDDVRHLDWRAFARTDQLLVRQYREEVLPRLELVLDASRSMASDAAKAQRAVDVAAVIVAAARASAFETAVIVLGERPERLDGAALCDAGVEADGRTPLATALREASVLLRPGTLRILVSDFLSPHEPRVLVRTLAQGAGALALVQVLSRSDADPRAGEALRLVDAETDESVDLVVDERARARYLARLGRLVRGLESECVRAGGAFASLRADVSLATDCREGLVRSGVLTPA